jgi:hypothetical protein
VLAACESDRFGERSADVRGLAVRARGALARRPEAGVAR